MFRKWAGLGAIAACLQRKCVLHVGKLETFPNMYIVLVGPSGSRKGTALKPLWRLLNKMPIHLASQTSTREAFILQMKDSQTIETNMLTGEVITHTSLTILAEELNVFLNADDKPLLEDLTDWYDCKEVWVRRTKTQGVDTLNNVWLTIIGATTPEKLSFMPHDSIAGGLAGRMIFVYESHKGRTEPEPIDEFPQLFLDLTHDLEIIASLSGEFQRTDEYRKIYADWYRGSDENPPFRESILAGYVDRRAIHAQKLSMLHSAARSSELVLRKEDIEQAIESLMEVEQKMQYAFAGVGQNKMAWVTRQLQLKLKERGRIAIKDVHSEFMQQAGYQEISNVLLSLRAMRICRAVYPLNGEEPYLEMMEENHDAND